MQAWLPTYFATELGLDMKSSALFSALPFATMALGSLVSGQASAALLQRMSPFEVRKRMVALSSVVPACSLLALSYVKSPAAALGLLVTALGAHSFPLLVSAHVLTSHRPRRADPGLHEHVGVLVGIVANVATGRVLDATGCFKRCADGGDLSLVIGSSASCGPGRSLRLTSNLSSRPGCSPIRHRRPLPDPFYGLAAVEVSARSAW